jgi:hypothetical protein
MSGTQTRRGGVPGREHHVDAFGRGRGVDWRASYWRSRAPLQSMCRKSKEIR